ncbi:hypothetical protein [Candidatus Doolittlea endobia]|nr:hypothetical protein [Candidatus Doolittlea endobia]
MRNILKHCLIFVTSSNSLTEYGNIAYVTVEANLAVYQDACLGAVM